MKTKFLFLLILICEYSFSSNQQILKDSIIQRAAGDSIITILKGDSVSFKTDKNHFSFNKPIKVYGLTYVDTASAQNITGVKTFTNGIKVDAVNSTSGNKIFKYDSAINTLSYYSPSGVTYLYLTPDSTIQWRSWNGGTLINSSKYGNFFYPDYIEAKTGSSYIHLNDSVLVSAKKVDLQTPIATVNGDTIVTNSYLSRYVDTLSEQTITGLKHFNAGLQVNKTLLYSPDVSTDVFNVRRYGSDYSVFNLWSPPQTSWAGAKEATISIVRGDSNQYFMDLYNMDYGPVSRGDYLHYGNPQMGLRLQKRYTGEYVPFAFEYSNGNYVQNAMTIHPNGTDSLNNRTYVSMRKLNVDSVAANVINGLTTPLSVAQGGTGSTAKNFVDLTTSQTITGTKTFSTTGLCIDLGSSSNSTGGLHVAAGNGYGIYADDCNIGFLARNYDGIPLQIQLGQNAISTRFISFCRISGTNVLEKGYLDSNLGFKINQVACTLQTLTDATTIAWSLTSGANATLTITDAVTARTLNASGGVAGSECRIIITQSANATYPAVSWGTMFKFPNDTAPVLNTNANGVTMLEFFFDGTYYRLRNVVTYNS